VGYQDVAPPNWVEVPCEREWGGINLVCAILSPAKEAGNASEG
jgi:hypothetical protein